MQKSFLLHIDSLDILDDLKDNQIAEFTKAIRYFHLNDELPEDLEAIVKIALKPIINQFKRDQEKWLATKEKRRAAGKRGGLKSGEVRQEALKQNEANEANASTTKQNEANEAVTVTVNDTVTGNVNKKKEIEEAFDTFWKSYTPIITPDGKCTSKGSRKPTLQAYEKALKNNHSSQMMLDGLKKYLERCKRSGTLTCAATTFLNQERFLDEDEIAIQADSKQTGKPTNDTTTMYNNLKAKYENEARQNGSA